MRVKNVDVSFKAGPDDGLEEGQFVVYASTFTKEPDSYGDVVAKGAFLGTIKRWKESGNELPGLYGHRMDDPDYFVAGALEMGEDDHGWWIKGYFDMDSPKGPQTYRLVKGRRLNQLSFAFDVLSEGQIELEDGRKANELRELEVYEFSFVPVGANPDTSIVAVKSTVDALTQGLKAGRVLAQKHIDSLREAHAAIGVVLDAAIPDEQEKASGQSVVKDEEPVVVKSEEPAVNPSVLESLEIYQKSLDLEELL